MFCCHLVINDFGQIRNILIFMPRLFISPNINPAIAEELIVLFMKSKVSVCWKYVGPVLLTGEVEAERGGSAIQIEVPAAVVSHVWKIGLNWSKWANLGGKETRGLNFRDF